MHFSSGDKDPRYTQTETHCTIPIPPYGTEERQQRRTRIVGRAKRSTRRCLGTSITSTGRSEFICVDVCSSHQHIPYVRYERLSEGYAHEHKHTETGQLSQIIGFGNEHVIFFMWNRFDTQIITHTRAVTRTSEFRTKRVVRMPAICVLCVWNVFRHHSSISAHLNRIII